MYKFPDKVVLWGGISDSNSAPALLKQLIRNKRKNKSKKFRRRHVRHSLWRTVGK